MSARGIGWSLWLTALAAPFALACAASPSGRESGADTGVRITSDGGHAVDAGGSVVDTGPLIPGLDGGAEANRDDPGAYAVACLDGIDENRSAGVDCSDPSCAFAASCCVGSSDARCCGLGAAPLHYDFACTTAPCATLADFTTFGDVGPIRMTDGSFAPESDHGTDSGAILTRELDPRAAIVTLTAMLGVPDHTSEIDAVGVGLVAGGPSAHVVPLAALVVSAARGEVLLLLGESVAGVLPAPTDGALHRYTLAIDPLGQVTATIESVHLTARVPLPEAPVHAAFFGRATNPGSLPTALPARIGSLDVSTAGCDQPAALTRLGGVTIIDHTGAALLATATDPSVASDGTSTVLAFSALPMASPTTAIFVGTRESDGAFHVRAPAGGTQPILVPQTGDALESPALAFAAGAWSLYATRVHREARSIVVATSSTADVLTLGAASDISIPDLAGDFSSPAPVPGDPTRLVVRHVARTSGDVTPGTAELVLLMLSGSSGVATPTAGLCGADSSCAGGRLQAHLYAARTATLSFDADDVDDPAIVLYDHVYRLYYAGRLGSRWSIGMLIAADLGYWRPTYAGAPILTPVGIGFDAVSVRSPAPIVENGRISLYYVGLDGDALTIALARGGSVPP